MGRGAEHSKVRFEACATGAERPSEFSLVPKRRVEAARKGKIQSMASEGRRDEYGWGRRGRQRRCGTPETLQTAFKGWIGYRNSTG